MLTAVSSLPPAAPSPASTPPASLTPVLAYLTAAAAGRERVARLLLCAVLSDGHVLLNDLPGCGKTTLAKALVRVLGLDFRRIQGTADLLPSDIVGTSVFDRSESRFVLHKGPVFTQVLLCDELNRCPPRTQSALLEAMAEGQVTVDGVSHELPWPFTVIATQNPVDRHTTLSFPHAQWDRFLFHLGMGAIDPATEEALMLAPPTLPPPPSPWNAVTRQAHRDAVEAVTVAPELSAYLMRLIGASRQAFPERGGLSLRAGQMLVRATRAWAWLSGRRYATPEDVAAVFVPVAAHRLLDGEQLGVPGEEARVQAVLTGVDVRF